MKLYFNGCSTTYGDELPEHTRLRSVWSSLVADHYKAESFNDAVKGGSNDRIVSRTILQINNFDKFYIQWSHIDRFTLHDANNWYEVNFQKQLVHSQYQNKDYFSKFGKFYYAYWSNSLFNFKRWLEQIILLQNFFEYHSKPYLMFSCSHNDYAVYNSPQEDFISKFSKIVDITNISDEEILMQYDQVQSLLKLINFKSFIPPSNMYAIQLVSKHPMGPGGHPLEEGHAELAKYIIDHEFRIG